jgi:hypothetical protein
MKDDFIDKDEYQRDYEERIKRIREKDERPSEAYVKAKEFVDKMAKIKEENAAREKEFLERSAKIKEEREKLNKNEKTAD